MESSLSASMNSSLTKWSGKVILLIIFSKSLKNSSFRLSSIKKLRSKRIILYYYTIYEARSACQNVFVSNKVHQRSRSIRTAGTQAVMTPSMIWRTGTNFFKSFFMRSVTIALPQRIAQSHQIRSHRISGIMPRATFPVIPSTTPKMIAFTATKPENTAKGRVSR